MSNKDEILVFTGSVMDGLTNLDGTFVDLVTRSGLKELADDQTDKLWNETTDYRIVRDCMTAHIEYTHETDEVPGQSDEFSDITTNDFDALKQEVRERILTNAQPVGRARRCSRPRYPEDRAAGASRRSRKPNTARRWSPRDRASVGHVSRRLRRALGLRTCELPT